MKSRIERLSKSELEFLIDNCNFTEDEENILKMSNRAYSEIQIADRLKMSASSVSKKKKKAFTKMIEFLEEMDSLTTIYVNGKRVTKNELKNYEIQLENVKKILKSKISKN